MNTKASRPGYFPRGGVAGESVSGQSTGQRGCFVQSPGSGGKSGRICRPPARRAQLRTGNAQGRTKSSSDTLTRPNSDTTYRDGQRLWVRRGKAGAPTLLLVSEQVQQFCFATLQVSDLLYAHLAQHKSYRGSAGRRKTNIALDVGSRSLTRPCRLTRSGALQSSVAKERGAHHQTLLFPSQTRASYVIPQPPHTKHNAFLLKRNRCFCPGPDEPKFNSFLLAQGSLPSKKNIPQNALARQHRSLSSTALADGGEGGLADPLHRFPSRGWSGRFRTPPYSITCPLPLNS